MNSRSSLPPLRDLPPGRLEARKGHLLTEIARESPPRLVLPRRRPLRLAAPALVVAAAAVALLLVAPWQRGPGLVDRALAAIGTGPVLHVVTERPSPYPQPVRITTGQPIPLRLRQEVWFDQSRDLKKTITMMNGTVVDQLLETRAGGFTPEGPVYTCAWIARHPLEATKAGVSCNADMQNPTTPRAVPERPPTLDLALSGFVDHYRAALASGQAKETGKGQFEGHDVSWLRIATSETTATGLPAYEEVAIDSSSYRPLLVRLSGTPPIELRVLTVDTQPYAPDLFTRPARVFSPSIGRVASSTPIDASAAPGVLDGKALWLGQRWQDFQLVAVERQELTTGYGPLSGRHPERSAGVAFEYARVQSDGTTESKPSITIHEATRCELAYTWTCRDRDPSGDTMLISSVFPSILQRDGIYVSISQVAATPAAIQIARALEPLTAR